MAKVAMPPLVVSLLFLIINTLASSSPGYLQFDIAKGGGGRLSRRQYSTWNAVIDQAIDKSEYLMQIGLGSPPQVKIHLLHTASFPQTDLRSSEPFSHPRHRQQRPLGAHREELRRKQLRSR